MHKRAFFAILAVSIVMTAASLGVSASRYLSLKYYAPPPPPAVRGTPPADAPGGQGPRPSALPPERWTNVFAPAQGMNIPSKAAKSQAEGPAPETRYVLIGTIASDAKASR